MHGWSLTSTRFPFENVKLFKINNRYIRPTFEICSKAKITSLSSLWCLYGFPHCFGVPTVDFQQVNGSWDNTYCAFTCIDCLLEIKSALYSKEVYQTRHINFLNQTYCEPRQTSKTEISAKINGQGR